MQKCVPMPNDEVRVGVAVHPERERVVEHLVVAVRRREEQRELVALVRSWTPCTSASSIAVRVKWMIGLT